MPYYLLTGRHQDAPHREVSLRRNGIEAAIRAYNLAAECGYEHLELKCFDPSGTVTLIASGW